MRKVLSIGLSAALALSPAEAAPAVAQSVASPVQNCDGAMGAQYRGHYFFEESGDRQGAPTDVARARLVLGQAAARYATNVRNGLAPYDETWLAIVGFESPDTFWQNQGIADAAVPAAEGASDALQVYVAGEGVSVPLIFGGVGLGGPHSKGREPLASADQSHMTTATEGVIVAVVMGPMDGDCSPQNFVDPR